MKDKDEKNTTKKEKYSDEIKMEKSPEKAVEVVKEKSEVEKKEEKAIKEKRDAEKA